MLVRLLQNRQQKTLITINYMDNCFGLNDITDINCTWSTVNVRNVVETETVVHVCHCPGDMAMRMCKVQAITN